MDDQKIQIGWLDKMLKPLIDPYILTENRVPTVSDLGSWKFRLVQNKRLLNGKFLESNFNPY